MKKIKDNIILIVYTKIFLLTDVKNNNTAHVLYQLLIKYRKWMKKIKDNIILIVSTKTFLLTDVK